MRSRWIAAASALACTAFLSVDAAWAQNQFPQKQEGGITLLAPLGGTNTINVGSGLSAWLQYFNDAAGWFFAVAMGICVAWVLVGAIELMISGAQSAYREKGKSHMFWAITGMVILLLAGAIMKTLNALFYK